MRDHDWCDAAKEVERLRRDLDIARATDENRLRDIERLRAENERLHRACGSLDTHEALQAEVERLRAELVHAGTDRSALEQEVVRLREALEDKKWEPTFEIRVDDE